MTSCQRGWLYHARAGIYPGKPGDFVINLKDVQNAEQHPDMNRLNGCCGLDGCNGYNLVCPNGHEIGTEQSVAGWAIA